MPQEKNAAGTLANTESGPLQTASGNATKAKRKSTDANEATAKGSEDVPTQTQKRQRKSVNSEPIVPSTLATSSHEILFGMPGLAFSSPFEGEMCFEVVVPSTKYKQGCIRLHGPQGHWNMDATFSLSFATIASIMILRNRRLNAGKKQAYEVLIVPKNSTGLAPIQTEKPAKVVIIFSLPEQKVDDKVYGSFTTGVVKGTQILTLLKSALNERLADFDKTVLDLSQDVPDPFIPSISRIDTALESVSYTVLTKKTKGILQMLDNGILFRSKVATLWIPVSELTEVCIIFAFEMGKGVVGTNLLFTVANRQLSAMTTDRPTWHETSLLSFHDVSRRLTKPIYRFAEERNVKIVVNRQQFYNYAKNSPVGSWEDMPPGWEEKIFKKSEEGPTSNPETQSR